MGWNEDGLGLWRICPICGKKFIPEVEHVYRDKSNPNRPPVCTYSCMRESERRAEKKREKRQGRYKRLDPSDMTEQQKRDRLNRTVKCGGCAHAKMKTIGEKMTMYCAHPDRETYNQAGVIAADVESKDEIKTPVWCPQKRELLEQWEK